MIWVAKYEEGFVDARGLRVSISSQIVVDHGWESPDDAIARWRERGDFENTNTLELDNGKEEHSDVRSFEAFARLGIVEIWRRITFHSR